MDPTDRPRRRAGNADKPVFQRGFSGGFYESVPPPRQLRRGHHGPAAGRPASPAVGRRSGCLYAPARPANGPPSPVFRLGTSVASQMRRRGAAGVLSCTLSLAVFRVLVLLPPVLTGARLGRRSSTRCIRARDNRRRADTYIPSPLRGPSLCPGRASGRCRHRLLQPSARALGVRGPLSAVARSRWGVGRPRGGSRGV